MGAYENPITVVDTESAKMWANAIQGLGNNFVQGISEIKKRRAAIDKAQADQDEWTFNYTLTEQRKMLDALSKAGANNPSLLAMTNDLLFKNAEAVKRQKYGSSAEEKRLGVADVAKYQSLLSRIVPLFNGIKKGKEDFTEHFDPTTNGDQGSLGYYGKGNQLMQKLFSIETAINPGKITWSANDDYTDINLTYKGERLDEPVTKKAAEIANYTFQIVPYSDKITSNLLQKSSKENPSGLGIVGTNGNLTSQYLESPNNYETVISDDGTIETIIAPPDYSKIASTMNQSLEQEAAKILTDYEMANSIWMNTMNHTTELKRSGNNGVGAVSEEDSIKFTNAWKLRAGGLIPNAAYISPESEEGREFLESAEGIEFMEVQGITKNEQGFYVRDIDGDKKATMVEVGLIPDIRTMKSVVKGTKKVSKDGDTDEEKKWKKEIASTKLRLETLTTNMKDLSLKGQQSSSSEGATIINFNSAFKKKIDNLGFDVGEAKPDPNYGQVVQVKSLKTKQPIELHSKGLTLSQLKQRLYLLDGGNTSDQAYKDLAPTDPWAKYRPQ